MFTEEANKTIKLAQEFMTPEQSKRFFAYLHDEVGLQTEDQSVAKLFETCKDIMHPPPAPPEFWVRPALYLLVAAHMAVVITMPIAFCMLPFQTPWYIAVPLMAFIWFFSSTRVPCRCTDAENYLRKKLKMKRIGGFMGHYFVKPLKLFWKRRRR